MSVIWPFLLKIILIVVVKYSFYYGKDSAKVWSYIMQFNRSSVYPYLLESRYLVLILCWHVGKQMLFVTFQSELEMQVFEKLTAMLKVMENKTGKELDKDVNRVNELIKVSWYFEYCFNIYIKSRGIVVSVVTGYGLDD